MIDKNRKSLIELQGEKVAIERDLDDKEASVQSLPALNRTEEKQIFEVLTIIFLERDEYSKSILFFDIDSLIMPSKSYSNMNQSTLISNIRLHQFSREKCKRTIVKQEHQENTVRQTDVKPVEK